MLKIQQKLKTDEYSKMSELKEDFDLLFKNAFTYYKKTAQEHKDATEFSDLFGKALGKLIPYRVDRIFWPDISNKIPDIVCALEGK